MNSSASNLLEEMKGKMGAYVVLLNYRYINICIKASPVSLLPIEAVVDNSIKKLEEVAQVAMVEDDEFKMLLYPMKNEYILPIGNGIMNVHPEFKQEVRELENSGSDSDEKMHCIELTMPEVDDARYKVITEAVKALNTECESKLKLCKDYYAAAIPARIMLEGSDDPVAAGKDVDEAKKQIEEIFNWHNDQRGSYTDAKNEEIEKAHNTYLEKMAEKIDGKLSGLDADGKDVALSMKME